MQTPLFENYPQTENKEILTQELNKRYIALEQMTREIDRIRKEIYCIIDRGAEVFDNGENIV